eukprot:g26517.t1
MDNVDEHLCVLLIIMPSTAPFRKTSGITHDLHCCFRARSHDYNMVEEWRNGVDIPDILRLTYETPQNCPKCQRHVHLLWCPGSASL